jgi:predicted dithiol-disulfide oxidoreductase (DUF899 family)
MKARRTKALPKIVSSTQWNAIHERLLAKEKAATRARDALAAERRRQPMVAIDKNYVFEGSDGNPRLLDLFEGRRQLIIYHFMFAPGEDGWPHAGCAGCSFFADQIGHLSHLQARDTFVGVGFPRTVQEYPAVQVAHGLDHAMVLLRWQRLQR